MNAPSAACCDDEDDEDGEAADMEGIDRCLSVVWMRSQIGPHTLLSFQNMKKAGCWKQTRYARSCLTSAIIRPTPA